MQDMEKSCLDHIPAIEPTIASLIVSPDDARCPRPRCQVTLYLFSKAYDTEAHIGSYLQHFIASHAWTHITLIYPVSRFSFIFSSDQLSKHSVRWQQPFDHFIHCLHYRGKTGVGCPHCTGSFWRPPIRIYLWTECGDLTAQIWTWILIEGMYG